MAEPVAVISKSKKGKNAVEEEVVENDENVDIPTGESGAHRNYRLVRIIRFPLATQNYSIVELALAFEDFTRDMVSQKNVATPNGNITEGIVFPPPFDATTYLSFLTTLKVIKPTALNQKLSETMEATLWTKFRQNLPSEIPDLRVLFLTFQESFTITFAPVLTYLWHLARKSLTSPELPNALDKLICTAFPTNELKLRYDALLSLVTIIPMLRNLELADIAPMHPVFKTLAEIVQPLAFITHLNALNLADRARGVLLTETVVTSKMPSAKISTAKGPATEPQVHAVSTETPTVTGQTKPDGFWGLCHSCHKPGHLARDCPDRKKSANPRRDGNPPNRYTNMRERKPRNAPEANVIATPAPTVATPANLSDVDVTRIAAALATHLNVNANPSLFQRGGGGGNAGSSFTPKQN